MKTFAVRSSIAVVLCLLISTFAFAGGEKDKCPTPKPKCPTSTAPKCPTKPVTTPVSSNSNSDSSSKSNSSASSDSSSKSTATNNTNVNTSVNNANTNAQQQSQTANGGNAVANGGSSNANGGSASASNTGNTQTSNTTYQAAKIPVSTAFAGEALATAPCQVANTGGGQSAAFGLSLGINHTDAECNKEHAVGVFAGLGDIQAAHDIACKMKAAKGIDACKHPFVLPTPEPAPVVEVPTPTATPVINNNVTVSQAQPTPVITVTQTAKFELQPCKLGYNGVLTNVCKRILDDAARRLEADTKAELLITGPLQAGASVEYLHGKGIEPNRIHQNFSDEQNFNLSFELSLPVS